MSADQQKQAFAPPPWSWPWPHFTRLDEGGFFKSHRDTPRSGTMFASLVVVFPTVHEGGALKLRHSGNEWTVDSAAAATAIDNFAFNPSNQLHHLSIATWSMRLPPVTSGHRVTLPHGTFTFNLLLSRQTIPLLCPTLWFTPRHQKPSEALEAAFTRVISDSNFMPEGGHLGFGLRQEYPLNPDVGLGNLIDCLKGSDAILRSVCCQLSLKTSLRIVYQHEEDDGDSTMIDHFFDFPRWKEIEILSNEIEKEGGKYISKPRPVTVEGYNYYVSEEPRLAWVTDLTEYTRTKTAYLAHGNEACLGCGVLHCLSRCSHRSVWK